MPELLVCECPFCGRNIQFEPAEAGSAKVCEHCEEEVQIPLPDEADGPATPAPRSAPIRPGLARAAEPEAADEPGPAAPAGSVLGTVFFVFALLLGLAAAVGGFVIGGARQQAFGQAFVPFAPLAPIAGILIFGGVWLLTPKRLLVHSPVSILGSDNPQMARLSLTLAVLGLGMIAYFVWSAIF